MNQIINRIGEYSMGNGPHLIGLDAAGSELGCPPEVFAPFSLCKITRIDQLYLPCRRGLL